MQCKHCGSIIRDNVKYCTQCGRSVLEIRNNIINNETTERMKEQFKNVSSNVVENFKNFDTEQAKQQTINFANNVKTDVKNFKTISRNKQIIYVVVFIIIAWLIFSIFNGGNSYTTKSDNFYGMRFNKTIEEFCEDYNNSLQTIYNELGETPSAIQMDMLNASDFSYYATQNNIKQYNSQNLNYLIMLFVESDSGYIVNACVGYDTSTVANTNVFTNFVIEKIYSATVMALTDNSYKETLDIIQDVVSTDTGICTVFKNNVDYYFCSNSSNSNIHYLYTMAMSKDRYKEIRK